MLVGDQIRTLIAALLMLSTAYPLAAIAATDADAERVTEIIKGLVNDGSEQHINNLLAKAISDRSKFLDVSYIDPNGDGSNSGWNAKYNFKYEKSSDEGFSVDSGRATLNSFALGLDVKGSYSYDEATNTDDLSKVSFSLSYIAGDFGELKVASKPQTEAYMQCVNQSPAPPNPDELSDEEFDIAAARYTEHDLHCWAEHEIGELVDSNARSYAYSIDVHAAVEGNQNFSDKNTTFGFQGLLSISDLPSLRVDLERVDASENETRKALTTEDEFDRVSAEIGYRYIFRDIGTYPISFYLSYRYFHELSAPAAVEAAELDSFDYTAVALRFPARMFGLTDSDDFHLFLRYTDGQLPFDRDSEQAVQLGFSSNIGVLGNLLN